MGNLCTSGPSYLTQKQKFDKVDQSHVFADYQMLTKAEQKRLLEVSVKFEPNMVSELFERLVVNSTSQEVGELEPVEDSLVFDLTDKNEEVVEALNEHMEDAVKRYDNLELDVKGYAKAGLEMIREGRAAVVILAGGQGTRLGFDHPKGLYDIGLASQRNIFRILIDRVMRIQIVAHGINLDLQELEKEQQKCKILIMVTPGKNKDETIEHFEQVNYYGYSKDCFVFFEQTELPAVSEDGKIIMGNLEPVMSPNGNGAFFDAVNNNPKIRAIVKSLDYVQVIGVDNVLNRVLCPVQLGFTKLNNLEASLKCGVKRSPDEKVGVLCKRDGKYDIVEYSELPTEKAEEMTDDHLTLELGSLLMFVIQAKKLLTLTTNDSLNKMYHVAHKKVPYFDKEAGELVQPTEPNAYKFELFLHNFLPFCADGKVGALKVDRHLEFAPVKNADVPDELAIDSPAMAKNLLLESHQTFIQRYKEIAYFGLNSQGIEIDGLLTYLGEGNALRYSCLALAERDPGTKYEILY